MDCPAAAGGSIARVSDEPAANCRSMPAGRATGLPKSRVDRGVVAAGDERSARRDDVRERPAVDADFEHAAVEVASSTKLLRNSTAPPASPIENTGEVNDVDAIVGTLPVATLFGALTKNDVVVAQSSAAVPPVRAAVHPAGSAGGVTLSKFSVAPGAGSVAPSANVNVRVP